jgi:hypothetical protein
MGRSPAVRASSGTALSASSGQPASRIAGNGSRDIDRQRPLDDARRMFGQGCAASRCRRPKHQARRQWRAAGWRAGRRHCAADGQDPAPSCGAALSDFQAGDRRVSRLLPSASALAMTFGEIRPAVRNCRQRRCPCREGQQPSRPARRPARRPASCARPGRTAPGHARLSRPGRRPASLRCFRSVWLAKDQQPEIVGEIDLADQVIAQILAAHRDRCPHPTWRLR